MLGSDFLRYLPRQPLHPRILSLSRVADRTRIDIEALGFLDIESVAGQRLQMA